MEGEGGIVLNEKNNNSPAVSSSDLEPGVGDGLLGAQETQGYASRVDIHIHSYRKRLADPDGISAKAVIDGIVKAGVIKDDSPEFVRQVGYSQEKAVEEKTVITVTLLD